MARQTPFNWKDRQTKSRQDQIIYYTHMLTSNPEYASQYPGDKRDLEKFHKPPTTLVKRVIEAQEKHIKRGFVPEPEIKQKRFNRVL
jgi:hypothetical protein